MHNSDTFCIFWSVGKLLRHSEQILMTFLIGSLNKDMLMATFEVDSNPWKLTAGASLDLVFDSRMIRLVGLLSSRMLSCPFGVDSFFDR